MSEPTIEPFYMIRAQEFIDLLFDQGYFAPEIKREDMRKLDDLLGYIIQSQCSSAVKCSELTRRIRERQVPHKKTDSHK